MKVIATKPGFYAGHLWQVGNEFDVAEGAKASWFTPVVEYKPPAKPKEAKGPDTLSGLAKLGVKTPSDLV